MMESQNLKCILLNITLKVITRLGFRVEIASKIKKKDFFQRQGAWRRIGPIADPFLKAKNAFLGKGVVLSSDPSFPKSRFKKDLIFLEEGVLLVTKIHPFGSNSSATF